jgi:hypothetical protein
VNINLFLSSSYTRPFRAGVATAVYLEGSLVFVSWGGVRLSPIGKSPINWSIVPASDGR